ncbi:MAG: DEAD/DEAH box helicase family protein [Cyanobacteria bacterium P01_F01_bin.13]
MNDPVLDVLPSHIELREWQSEFLDTFFNKTLDRSNPDRSPNFLLVATPGAGKTWTQLSIAYILKKRGLIDWIVICVPTDHLRNQMGRDAAQNFGIDLYHSTGFVDEEEYCGEVVTYAQVANAPKVWRARCDKKKIMLCSDEVHHLGDDLTWGEKYKHAFENASYRLSTSGTPFRTDNQQIPWVDYEQDENTLKSIADYEYGYGRAVKDSVCRHVIFPTFDAHCEWQYGFNRFSASYSDELSKRLSSQRRNTTIDADGQWIEKVFLEADSRLSSIRDDGHVDAGGLVVCKDKAHADKIAKLIKKKTGSTPLLVTSDDTKASDKIEAFAAEKGKGAKRWIVAVKMVSEGVDIKRLRVAIYASNVMTEMYFRQFVGRVIRMIGGGYEETAYVYVYPDADLLSHIQRIKEEVRHEFKLEDDGTPKKADSKNKSKTPGNNPLKFFVPMEALPAESDHYWDQKRFGILEINAVKGLATEMGIPEAKTLALLKRGQELGLVDIEVDPPVSKQGSQPSSRESKNDRKKKLSKRCNGMAVKLALSCLDIEPIVVHQKWGRKPQSKMQEPELLQKRDWLGDCLSIGSMIEPQEWRRDQEGEVNA